MGASKKHRLASDVAALACRLRTWVASGNMGVYGTAAAIATWLVTIWAFVTRVPAS